MITAKLYIYLTEPPREISDVRRLNPRETLIIICVSLMWECGED